MAKVRRRTRRFILSGAALFVAAGCTASADAQPLIQGGSVHYSPFLARVAYGVGGVEEALCSGTVITPHWILTAGHCVGNPEEAGGKTFPPSYFKVYTGNVNWTKATLSTVSEALRNPNYYSNHLVPPNDDVGMLHLSSAVTVEPIQLATPTTFANEVKVGASVSATGFGLTSPGAPVPPEDMYLVTGLTVEYFPEHEAGENNDVEIGSVASKGTCSGDSGGPFIDSAGEEVAITSAGPANACNQTAAQRIDLVDPWITESVEKSEPPTVSSISPTAGLPGTEVAIHGLWMKKATGVSFGSTPAAKFTVISASEIKATVPAGRGVVDVRVSNANGPSPVVAGDKFNQLAPETRISYTGPEHAVKGQASTLSAHLVEAATAAPLAGATVRFEAAGTNCEAMTESAGNGTSFGNFFLDTPNGFAGIGFSSSGVGASYYVPGLPGQSINATVSGPVTLELARSGDVFTASYSSGGAFTTLYSITSPNLLGAPTFDLTTYSAIGSTATQALTFSAFNVTSVPEPSTWAMILIGLGGMGALVRSRARGHSSAAWGALDAPSRVSMALRTASCRAEVTAAAIRH